MKLYKCTEGIVIESDSGCAACLSPALLAEGGALQFTGSNRVPMSSHDSILAAQVPPSRQPEHRPAAAGSATGRLGHLDEPR